MLIILKSLNILSVTMFLLSLHSLVVRIPNGQRFTNLLWALGGLDRRRLSKTKSCQVPCLTSKHTSPGLVIDWQGNSKGEMGNGWKYLSKTAQRKNLKSSGIDFLQRWKYKALAYSRIRQQVFSFGKLKKRMICCPRQRRKWFGPRGSCHSYLHCPGG